MFERARHEENLKRELEKFKKLFLEAFDAIFIFDTSGLILDANKAAQEITGFSKEELLGMSAYDLRPPEERVRVKQILSILAKAGFVTNVSDTHIKTKDGRLIPVEVNAKVIEIDSEPLTLSIFRDITQRKRIEAEIRERNENLQILNEVALDITSRLDLREILTKVVRSAVEMEGADAGAIGFYNKEMDEIYYPFVCNLPHYLGKIIAVKGRDLAKHIVDSKKPLIIEDYPSYEFAIKELVEAGVKSMMLVPILSKGTAFGVLGVFNLTAKKTFTERGLWLLKSIGRQAAIAIENSRLFEEAKERARRIEAASEVSRVISSTLDVSEVLHRVINEVSKAIGTEVAGIFFYRPESNEFYGKMGYGPVREQIQDIVEKAEDFPLAVEAVSEKKVILITDIRADPRVPAKYVERYGLRSIMILPLIVKRRLIGVIALAHTDEEHRFTDDQVDFAKSIAAQAAIAIENARLYEGERYVSDVLQRSFLPESTPDIPNTSVATFYTSSSEVGRVGGDFYDFIDLSDNLFGFVIGDVSGKGVEVAATTSLAKYTLRAFAYGTKHPSVALESANNVITREIGEGKFITLAYLIYDSIGGKLLMSNAGHPYPVHYVASAGKAHLIENVNVALGVLSDFNFSEAIERLAPGDVLVLYTDGLIEARRDSLFYGPERLMRLVEEVAPLSVKGIVRAIVADVNEFAQGKLEDDIALNVFKRN